MQTSKQVFHSIFIHLGISNSSYTSITWVKHSFSSSKLLKAIMVMRVIIRIRKKIVTLVSQWWVKIDRRQEVWPLVWKINIILIMVLLQEIRISLFYKMERKLFSLRLLVKLKQGCSRKIKFNRLLGRIDLIMGSKMAIEKKSNNFLTCMHSFAQFFFVRICINSRLEISFELFWFFNS